MNYFKKLYLRLTDETIRRNVKKGWSSCSCKNPYCTCPCLSGGFVGGQVVQNICFSDCVKHTNNCRI